jgi:hypothetical protein
VTVKKLVSASNILKYRSSNETWAGEAIRITNHMSYSLQ